MSWRPIQMMKNDVRSEKKADRGKSEADFNAALFHRTEPRHLTVPGTRKVSSISCHALDAWDLVSS